jgi:hypothetical protein
MLIFFVCCGEDIDDKNDLMLFNYLIDNGL